MYTNSFFRSRKKFASNSATVLVPILCELFKPRSVVDIGCGDGAWLAEFRKHDVTRILGVDGPWVNTSNLEIDNTEFQKRDLTQTLELAAPKFDLCICLEVAEHLPRDCASHFVNSLTQLSDVVVFSAAIPYQGGTGHVNEQWPDYWASKFAECSFIPIDCIRDRVWDEPSLAPHYAQNVIVYASDAPIKMLPQLRDSVLATDSLCLTRIHPELWKAKMLEAQDLSRFGLLAMLKMLPAASFRSVSGRIQRLLTTDE